MFSGFSIDPGSFGTGVAEYLVDRKIDEYIPSEQLMQFGKGTVLNGSLRQTCLRFESLSSIEGRSEGGNRNHPFVMMGRGSTFANTLHFRLEPFAM